MEEELRKILVDLHWTFLLGIVAVSLSALAKFADIVVDQAVILSSRSGIPKVIVGATVVSLGTTAPEVAVSVFAAFKGKPGLAMGNAVGSIICDTGLILGIACLISPPRIPAQIANRQGWVQLAAGAALVLFSVPWHDPLGPFNDSVFGNFSQFSGFIFLGLLALYLWLSVKWTRGSVGTEDAAGVEGEGDGDEGENSSAVLTVLKLIGAITGVIVSANLLIPAVDVLARRVNVPDEIIAATLVAFGTSLPELVTAVQAARRGHGDLAVGNIIGADVLNALFVAGAAAAVTPNGLDVSPDAFKVLFPAMLFVLIVFRSGILIYKDRLPRGFGFVLLGAYLLYLSVSIATGVKP